jgi:type I restriction enzyme S subunit
LAQRIILLRAKPELLDPLYLFYALQSDFGQGELRARASGTTVLGIKQSELRKVRIPVFPLPIQRRIAGILSAYDELIENSQRRIKILESMARGLYREWFVHFRFPGHESVPRVKSPLGEIPEGWEVKAFSQLASYVNGYPFKPAQLGKEGKPIIKIKELKAGIVADTPRNPGEDIPEKYNIRDGDVLFSWSADLDAYLWMGGEGLLNQHLFTVLPADGISLAFCFHALKEAMPRFRALSLGATMHHIKRSALDQVFTVVAPMTTRKRFDVLVEPIHKQLITLTNYITNLRRTRDLLLPRLLSGQIDVEAMAP